VTASTALTTAVVSVVMLAVCTAVWRRNLDRDLLRSRQLGRVAEEAGWSFSTDDVFDYAQMGFALFTWRSSGRASNVLVGRTADGRPVCAFDYRVSSSDHPGPDRFTCVLTDLGVHWPRVVVQPRDQGARWPSLDAALLDQLPAVDVHDAFRAWSVDGSFAHMLLTGTLGDWLATTWPDAQFEIAGPLLMVWCPQRSPRRLHETLRASDALRSRVPREVWGQYPVDETGGSR
jgi:hypothetical protein